MRKRITPGTVLGAVAVLLCLSGTAFAAKTVITSKDIKDGTIQTRDLSSGLEKKVNRGGAQGGTPGVPGPAGAAGPAGPAGAKGETGAQGLKGETGAQGLKGETGAQGPKGLSGYEVRTYDYIRAGHRAGKDGVDAGYPGAGGGSIATVACSSEDKVATGGGYFIRNGNDDAAPGTGTGGAFTGVGGNAGVVASFPGRMDWSNNTVRPNRLDGWIVQFNGNAPLDVTLYVICVNAP